MPALFKTLFEGWYKRDFFKRQAVVGSGGLRLFSLFGLDRRIFVVDLILSYNGGFVNFVFLCYFVNSDKVTKASHKVRGFDFENADLQKAIRQPQNLHTALPLRNPTPHLRCDFAARFFWCGDGVQESGRGELFQKAPLFFIYQYLISTYRPCRLQRVLRVRARECQQLRIPW